jgi:ATP-dependent DNA helicase RecQ
MMALQLYTQNASAVWKSTFQESWVTSVFEGEMDMLVVAKTGGGKSMAYTLPPLVEHNEITVVIQPLIALAMESMDVLKALNIRAFYWEESTANKMPHNTQVVVVSSQTASKPPFYEAMVPLRIRRFIIDEAHQYLDDVTYRSYMAGVARLRRLHGQFVFTTGTLQPCQELPLLAQTFNLIQVKTFREPTVRRELFWEVKDLKIRSAGEEEMVDLVEREWRDRIYEAKSQAMIFVPSREGVEALQQELTRRHIPSAFYHSSLEPEQAVRQASKWRKSGKCIMVATCAFGAGINYPNVRSVIILGLPNLANLNQVVQEAGRAGRDGEPAKVLLVSLWKAPWESDNLTQELLNKGACPVGALSKYLDNHCSTCSSLRTSRKCPACKVSSAPRRLPWEEREEQAMQLVPAFSSAASPPIQDEHSSDCMQPLSDLRRRRLPVDSTADSSVKRPRHHVEQATREGSIFLLEPVPSAPTATPSLATTTAPTAASTSTGRIRCAAPPLQACSTAVRVNQAHVQKVVSNQLITVEAIAELIDRYKDCCGWCLAKDSDMLRHQTDQCPDAKWKCFRCFGS